jgi:hypothetical protein
MYGVQHLRALPRRRYSKAASQALAVQGVIAVAVDREPHSECALPLGPQSDGVAELSFVASGKGGPEDS